MLKNLKKIEKNHFKKIFGKQWKPQNPSPAPPKMPFWTSRGPPRGMVVVLPRCQKVDLGAKNEKLPGRPTIVTLTQIKHARPSHSERVCTVGRWYPGWPRRWNIFWDGAAPPWLTFFIVQFPKFGTFWCAQVATYGGGECDFYHEFQKPYQASLRWPYKFIFLYGHGQFTWPFPTVTIRAAHGFIQKNWVFWIFLYFSMFFSPP